MITYIPHYAFDAYNYLWPDLNKSTLVNGNPARFCIIPFLCIILFARFLRIKHRYASVAWLWTGTNPLPEKSDVLWYILAIINIIQLTMSRKNDFSKMISACWFVAEKKMWKQHFPSRKCAENVLKKGFHQNVDRDISFRLQHVDKSSADGRLIKSQWSIDTLTSCQLKSCFRVVSCHFPVIFYNDVTPCGRSKWGSHSRENSDFNCLTHWSPRWSDVHVKCIVSSKYSQMIQCLSSIIFPLQMHRYVLTGFRLAIRQYCSK